MPAFGLNNSIHFDPGTSVGSILKKTGEASVGAVTAIPESLIVPNQTLATFTALVSGSATVLSGTSVSAINFAWTYNRNSDNPTSQTITLSSSSNVTGAPTPGSQAVALRSSTSSGLTMGITGAPSPGTATFLLSAIGDDGTASSLSATIAFRNRRYFGVSQDSSLTQAQIRALSFEFAVTRPDTETFDASVGGGNNYLYFVYPSYLGSPASTLFNGFLFTDYTQSTISAFNNSTGFTEDYIQLRTNNTYSGSNISWQIT